MAVNLRRGSTPRQIHRQECCASARVVRLSKTPEHRRRVTPLSSFWLQTACRALRIPRVPADAACTEVLRLEAEIARAAGRAARASASARHCGRGTGGGGAPPERAVVR